MWGNVLVATDGSERSAKAVERALEIAEKEGAKVTLMAVAYYARDDLEEMPFNIQGKLEAQAQKALTEAKALFDAKGIAVKTVLETGLVPANNIIRRAEEDKHDLIIMGSTGITGLKRFLLGSTASKVVAHAPCSVAVIR
ncbi:universal stress protein [Syntrophobacter fumaroxidans]|uniref:Universal stress protein n=1 Tax=Syntrophobacter fumaroxidans (strain DSM 10017 / MPOB) TaxID=335543 RepID=A0LFX1_SYNFM|nr:universal stress protein [Syntrophobacter fumaroxidans]ABK16323.1 UspA domain protein [Syntrophobacter fumaroxidans MPOB]HOI94360.1 universal stress protein [Syntrophobacter fumaroxidans]